MAKPKQPEDKRDLREQYRFVYETVSGKLSAQIGRLQAIDTKATIILAAIAALLLGIFQLLGSENLTFREYKPLIVIELTGLFLAGGLVFRSFILGRYEGWRNDPNPKKLDAYFLKNWKKGTAHLQAKLITEIAESYETNRAQIKKKHRYQKYGSALFGFSVFVLLIHISAMVYDVKEIVIPIT